MNDLKFTTAGNYMNSKIDDFIYQSGLIAAGCWDKFDDYDKKAIEKFGELIVKECANMAESFHYHQYDFTGNLELHEFIRQHFLVNK